MRLGKLAVDCSMQGRGLGEELLMESFRKAVSLSSEVGIFAVISCYAFKSNKPAGKMPTPQEKGKTWLSN
jgi:hypothetical protein